VVINCFKFISLSHSNILPILDWLYAIQTKLTLFWLYRKDVPNDYFAIFEK